MKSKIIVTILVLCFSLVTGCVANQPKDGPPAAAKGQVVVSAKSAPEKAESKLTTTATAQPKVLEPEEIVPERPGLDLRGQTVTGHKVTKRWGDLDKMTFTTANSVSSGKTWALVCDELVDGKVPPHVSFYWHGDNPRWVEPGIIAKKAKEIRQDTCWIVVYRPHSMSRRDWRTPREMIYHLALVDYFIATVGVNRFDVYGSSGGGTVAAMVLQERRRHVRFAGLDSPILAVRAREPYVDVTWVYDPHYYIRRLTFRTAETLPVCILIARDPRDKQVNEKGVLPYIQRARELGLGEDQVKLVEVRATDLKRHQSHKGLGREMRRLKREKSFCL